MSLSRKPRIFLDTSVLVSSLFSTTGASAEIIRLTKKKVLTTLVSDYVLEEARRTLLRKALPLLPSLDATVKSSQLAIVPPPTKSKVLRAEQFISDPSDAPILASARVNKVNYLVTLDTKHFLKDPRVAQKSQLTIITPGQLLKLLKSRK